VLVPTTRFWLLIAAGIPLALVGAVVPGFERILLPYNVFLFTCLVTTWFVARRWNFLEIQRVTTPIFSVNVANPVRIDVENVSDINLKVMLRDEPPADSDATSHEFLFDVPAGGVKQLSYTITPRHRGNDAFRGTFVRWMAPMGLAWVEKQLPTLQKAPIYPNVRALTEYDLLKQKGHLGLMGVRRSRIKGLGTEFESLREYNDDDYRTIDWKSTARTGKLVVRNFEVERNQGVIVALDVGRHMLSEVAGRRKLDYAIDSSLMLMHAAEKMGDQIGLLMFSDVVNRYIAPKKGRAQVSAILDTVHGVHAEPVQPNYQSAFAYLANRWKRRSLVVVFTDAENEDQAAELSAALATLKKRHLLFVVRVADPRLREVVTTKIEKPTDLFARSAALWYFRDRTKADTRLSTAGIHSIESEPQDLSATLVSAYLRVKELALI
jgi:uncharacterized protein (DUF58 family)